jgi:hypothetical protein
VKEASPENRNIILIIKEKVTYAKKWNYPNVKDYHSTALIYPTVHLEGKVYVSIELKLFMHSPWI